jgi:molybdopterin/thiamine biosynthesis adenylyltransferase
MKAASYKTKSLKKRYIKDLNYSQAKIKNFDLGVLQDTDVLMIGAGAIGSHVAFALVRKGTGKLDIYDDDTVELKNLTRQLFSKRDVGKNKARCLAKHLSGQGFFQTTINGFPYRFQEALEDGRDMSGYSAVICGVDNNVTRVAAARYCIEKNMPLIMCAVSRDGDQMYCLLQKPRQACFGCMMPGSVNDDTYPCNLPGIIDIIQVVSGFTVYALDTILMDRYCEWNLKSISIDGSMPDASLLIQKKPDCNLCGRA